MKIMRVNRLSVLMQGIVITCIGVSSAMAQGDPKVCVAIADNSLRLNCFDNAMKEVIIKPSVVSDENFGKEHKQDFSEETGPRIFTVASARHNDFTGWTMIFENGQTWTQVGTDRYRIKKGGKYSITRATFNSFLLGNLEDNRSIRISRID